MCPLNHGHRLLDSGKIVGSAPCPSRFRIECYSRRKHNLDGKVPNLPWEKRWHFRLNGAVILSLYGGAFLASYHNPRRKDRNAVCESISESPAISAVPGDWNRWTFGPYESLEPRNPLQIRQSGKGLPKMTIVALAISKVSAGFSHVVAPCLFAFL